MLFDLNGKRYQIVCRKTIIQSINVDFWGEGGLKLSLSHKYNIYAARVS